MTTCLAPSCSECIVATTPTTVWTEKSLRNYIVARNMEQAGSAVFESRDSAWVAAATGGHLRRFPLGQNARPSPDTVRSLLRRPGVWLLSYKTQPDSHHPANCIHYVCDDPNYDVAALRKHTRSHIRRGLRQFDIRPISLADIRQKGQEAHSDTEQRHGYCVSNPHKVCTCLPTPHTEDFYQAWGAWDGEHLVAWLTVLRVDNWAMIESRCGRSEALKNRCDWALMYEATRHLLVDQGVDFVPAGYSSILVNANNSGLHQFKERMGFRSERLHRHCVAHPMLRPALKTRTASHVWEALARWMPHRASLGKIAGLSRLMAGREEAPLAFATE